MRHWVLIGLLPDKSVPNILKVVYMNSAYGTGSERLIASKITGLEFLMSLIKAIGEKSIPGAAETFGVETTHLRINPTQQLGNNCGVPVAFNIAALAACWKKVDGGKINFINFGNWMKELPLNKILSIIDTKKRTELFVEYVRKRFNSIKAASNHDLITEDDGSISDEMGAKKLEVIALNLDEIQKLKESFKEQLSAREGFDKCHVDSSSLLSKISKLPEQFIGMLLDSIEMTRQVTGEGFNEEYSKSELQSAYDMILAVIENSKKKPNKKKEEKKEIKESDKQTPKSTGDDLPTRPIGETGDEIYKISGKNISLEPSLISCEELDRLNLINYKKFKAAFAGLGDDKSSQQAIYDGTGNIIIFSNDLKALLNLKDIITKEISNEHGLGKYISAEDRKLAITIIDKQPIDDKLIKKEIVLPNEALAIIQAALKEHQILVIGESYVNEEARYNKIRVLTDKDILKRIIFAIELVNLRKNYETTDRVLGYIGACANELCKRKSPLISMNTGIPWKELSYLHRIIFNKQLRPCKYLPGITFSEGIYHDPTLYAESRKRIISQDFPQLRECFIKLIDYSFYAQRFPIATNTQRIYEFYYDETHLQFLKNGTAAFRAMSEELSLLKKIYPFAVNYYLFYIVVIGEAFSSISKRLLKEFDPIIIGCFKDAREKLAHPERETNKILIEKLQSGELNILEFLGITEDKLEEYVEHIHGQTISLQKREYNYQYNVEIEHFSKLLSDLGFKDGQHDFSSLPPHFQRILSAPENALHSGRTGTFKVLRLTYAVRPVEELLDEAYLGNQFYEKCQSLVQKIENYNIYDLISFLSKKFDLYVRCVEKTEKTENDNTVITNFDKLAHLVNKNLSNSQGIENLNVILFYLHEFLPKYKNFSEDEVEQYDRLWIKSGKMLIEFDVEKHSLDELPGYMLSVSNYLQLFKSLYDSGDGYSGIFSGKKYREHKVAGKQEFKRHYEFIKKISHSIVKNNKENKKSEKTEVPENAEIIKDCAKEAVDLLNNISLMHVYTIELEKYFDRLFSKYRDKSYERVWLIDRIYGSMQAYFTVICGSLTRRLLENQAVTLLATKRFVSFFKDNFQKPRGRLSHNQIPQIGDEEYVNEMINLRGLRKKEGEAALLSMTGIINNIVQDDAEAHMEIYPRYSLPSVKLSKDFLYHDPIKQIFIQLNIFTKINEHLFCFFSIERDEVALPKVIAYLTDNAEKLEEDLPALKENNFLELDCSEAIRPEEWESYNNKNLEEIYNDQEISGKIISYFMDVANKRFCNVTVDISFFLFIDNYYEKYLTDKRETDVPALMKDEAKEKVEVDAINTYEKDVIDAPNLPALKAELKPHAVLTLATDIPAIAYSVTTASTPSAMPLNGRKWGSQQSPSQSSSSIFHKTGKDSEGLVIGKLYDDYESEFPKLTSLPRQ